VSRFDILERLSEPFIEQYTHLFVHLLKAEDAACGKYFANHEKCLLKNFVYFSNQLVVGGGG